MLGQQRYQSWGHYPPVKSPKAEVVRWQSELTSLGDYEGTMLPFGNGRSYGDSCLNEDGLLLDTNQLRRFISFDTEQGLLCCEAGVRLDEILAVIVPRGWFLPVSPGTKFITIGGAIANDIHGKNHHMAGTFGCHVTRFGLLRSNGDRLICSPTENRELFRATIGGLGLTGLIVWAEFRLHAIPGPFIAKEQIKFGSLDEFFEVSADSDKHYEYTMAWVDCLAQGKSLGRGLFMQGNFAPFWERKTASTKAKPKLGLPMNVPNFVLNHYSMKAFNFTLYNTQQSKIARSVTHYDPFFYPLDSIHDWNRMYGSNGFLQYQFVIPFQENRRAIRYIFTEISASGEGSFLAVLKTFGNIQSPGMLSFPRPGVTLALDFSFKGQSTLELLNRLDEIVLENGGAVYPAKDARMSAKSFQTFFPNWQEFAQYVDPKFSSNFWRRVTPNLNLTKELTRI